MILNKLSIRWKITLSNMLLLTVISVLLYIGANRSADRAIESIPMTQIASQATTSTDANEDPSQFHPESKSIPAIPIQTPQQAAKEAHRRTMNFYAIGTILLGGLVTFIIAKHSLKPLEDLKQRIKNTNLQKLSEKIVMPRPDPEITCLVDAFNEMTNKLDQSFVLQKQFSHSLAHELRTPLTVIRTKIEVFQKKDTRTAQELSALLNLIQTYTQNLSGVVEDILQCSNLSDIPLEDPIILETMLTKVLTEINAIYSNCCISLEPSSISCKGNAMLLHRVFSNIIENACRYGQGQRCVSIRINQCKETIAIQISDNGIGILDHDKVHIFEPFYRVDQSRSRAFGGAGLGLYFCKEIISRHGGMISVSDNEPCGTLFTITLPTRLTEI